VAIIEARWVERFGADLIGKLRASLAAIVRSVDVTLPQGLPIDTALEELQTFPARTHDVDGDPALAIGLSQALFAFAIDFTRDAGRLIADGANILRVVDETGVRLGDLPHLTGASPETIDIGWRLEKSGWVVVAADPSAARGKIVRLAPRGVRARETYQRLVAVIERRWRETYGADIVSQLRACLEEVLTQRDDRGPRIARGLVPPDGVLRAGVLGAALGRRDVGPAARRRMHDLVVQSENFVRDPLGTLPHYPLWDMNRGFGP
jgi:hypothetical protein